jgi:predicted DNA-binding transcriptional regulator AlpA
MKSREQKDEEQRKMRERLAGKVSEPIVTPTPQVPITKQSEAVEAIVQPRLMKMRIAARYMGMSETALRQRKHGGTVPPELFKKVGGSILWDRIAIDKWIDDKSNGKRRH